MVDFPRLGPSTRAFGEDDRDLLHSVALKWLPIRHPGLRQERIVKNSKLESVIELYSGASVGSGHIPIEDVPRQFPFTNGDDAYDLPLLRRLAELPSYDIYTLRILLRDMGMSIDEQAHLRLSDAKVTQLGGYMRAFTRPLLLKIYGGESSEISSFADVIRLFRDPDIQEARRKLQLMATTLGIQMVEIPRFLEDYADIFLSLSYYKSALDDVIPVIDRFNGELEHLKKSHQLRSNSVFMEAADEACTTFSASIAMVTGSIESFNLHTRDMWKNISAQRFSKIGKLIRAYHITLGGILCGLTVKMEAWKLLFPRKEVGGPNRRGEFIMSDLRHGLARIRQIQSEAPSIRELVSD